MVLPNATREIGIHSAHRNIKVQLFSFNMVARMHGPPSHGEQVNLDTRCAVAPHLPCGSWKGSFHHQAVAVFSFRVVW